MKETLKMMNEILLGNEKERSLSDLLEEYKQLKSPNILAYFYCSNFGLINNICEMYPRLDDEDKASFCLQEIDNCLFNYDINKNAKFSTYISKCIKNRLRAETELCLTDKRKIRFYTKDITIYSEELIDTEIDFLDYNEFQNEYKLTNDELIQCKLLNEGYNIKEVGKIINKSISYLYVMNNKIKEKILKNSINFG